MVAFGATSFLLNLSFRFQRWFAPRARPRVALNQRREDLFGEFSATCLLHPKDQGRRLYAGQPMNCDDLFVGECESSLMKAFVFLMRLCYWAIHFPKCSRTDSGSGIGYSKDEGQVKPHGDPNKSSREATLPSHKTKVRSEKPIGVLTGLTTTLSLN